MILLWLSYVCLINGLAAQTANLTPDGAGDKTIINVNDPYKKTVLCSYRRNMNEDNPSIPKLEAQDLPTECEALIYERVSVSVIAQINVDYESLKLATCARPVIVSIARDNGYRDWAKVLTPEGNQAEADALCKFAKENDIKGFMLTQLAPKNDEDVLNVNISQFVIPYLKQLKCSENFIVGVSVIATSPFIKCPCVYDFAKMNPLVSFYRIYTYSLNSCRSEIYNGEVGLKSMKHGMNYVVGMVEVTEFLQESKAMFDKLYYAVQLGPSDANQEFTYNSYVEVCKGTLNLTHTCVQNTNDYFEKGKYVISQNAGLNPLYVELDDVDNTCNCGKFIGFNNIMAGYNEKSAIPCPKFDVQIACT